jgi:sugar transferase (PEP-CTERM/EpsH1 system associated)
MLTPNDSQSQAPLIAHVLFRLGTGGLENGLVNLINNLPSDKYRHAIICMTDYTDFRDRLQRSDVEVYCLHKREGKDFHVYVRLWRLLKELKPDVLHTRNLSALEAQLPGFLLGVKCRIHGEHGRDVDDLYGTNVKNILLRKFFRSMVQRYLPMSEDLAVWLQQTIGVAPQKISQIYNGVDMAKFQPLSPKPLALLPDNFREEGLLRIGAVGRQAEVKNPLLLLEAFIELVQSFPESAAKVRLIMVGNGILHKALQDRAFAAGVAHLVWLPGDRSDVAQLMQTFEVFVLPSLNEGISNTILEAMASNLPVIATRVGGSPELVADEQSGFLVESGNPKAMAAAIKRYVDQPELAKQHGDFGRDLCRQRFSLQRMLQDYMQVYDSVLAEHG